MKILLSWLLDYIDCPLSDLDIYKIVHLFNIRTAEIESFNHISSRFSTMFLGQAAELQSTMVTFFCPELGKTILMPSRLDVVVGKWYLAMQDGEIWRWVLLSDFDKEKEGIMPAMHVLQVDQKGGWRSKMPIVDYVLDVDNKSINHRPDLWGHYGIAREIAAFLNLPLKPLSKVMQQQAIASYESKSDNVTKDGLAISLQSNGCFRFAALFCGGVVYQDSDIKMAIRLASVGVKPMNAIVDLTNYVMFDIGHPMHVFDALAFAKRTMILRNGQSAETLQLLDGQIAKLTPQDLVVANDTQALSLAGIMGGKDFSYQPTTKAIVLEAAGFDPAIIRKTAQRLKVRTEASMRFEKYVDPMQNVVAIQRFLYLAHEMGVLPQSVEYPIVSVGMLIKPQVCTVAHQFIQTRLGMDDITPEFVLDTLKKLDFGVTYQDGLYTVTIPTSRATKDVNIVEDIVEEVIRFYGFENITSRVPMRQTVPFSIQVLQNVRYIKRQLAYGMAMHEVRDYMLYDASWVSRLQVDVLSAVRVKSPLSENWTTLVTSLIPHLLKSVEQNSAQKDHLRFFEYNRTWSKQLHEHVEQKVLAGIIFDKKSVDFYESKAELQSLWDALGLLVVYRKPQVALPMWYDQYQAAEIMVGSRVIGTIGIMSVAWMHHVIDGSAFIFEINADFLENIKPIQNRFISWSKFQDVSYDISLFVPLAVTSDAVCLAISKAHADIKKVQIVDFFEKEEWKEHRAVTVRYSMNSLEKTMTKHDLDSIVQAVHAALKVCNVQIR